jgi:hypothetical protein
MEGAAAVLEARQEPPELMGDQVVAVVQALRLLEAQAVQVIRHPFPHRKEIQVVLEVPPQMEAEVAAEPVKTAVVAQQG